MSLLNFLFDSEYREACFAPLTYGYGEICVGSREAGDIKEDKASDASDNIADTQDQQTMEKSSDKETPTSESDMQQPSVTHIKDEDVSVLKMPGGIQIHTNIDTSEKSCDVQYQDNQQMMYRKSPNQQHHIYFG